MFFAESAMQNEGLEDIVVTCHAHEKFNQGCLRPAFRNLAGLVVWAAISYGFKSKIIFWHANSGGKMIAQGYIDYLLPLVQAEFWAFNSRN